MRAAGLFVVLATSPALAGPIDVMVGAGPCVDRSSSDAYHPSYDRSEARSAAELQLEVGVRVSPALSLGVHTGVMQDVHARKDCIPDDMQPGQDLCFTSDDDYTAFSLGAFARVTIRDRVWLAPWAGAIHHDASFPAVSEWRPGLGLGAGVDLVRRQPHRLGLVLSVAGSRAESTYQYWDAMQYPVTRQDLRVGIALAYRLVD